MFWDIPAPWLVWLSGAFSQRKITANSGRWEANLPLVWARGSGMGDVERKGVYSLNQDHHQDMRVHFSTYPPWMMTALFELRGPISPYFAIRELNTIEVSGKFGSHCAISLLAARR